MVDSIQVEEVFDRVWVNITKALTGLEMKSVAQDHWKAENTLVETIYTSGNFDAYILCELDLELYEYIISAMYGGGMPPEEERILYLNEYINIICGRAVSVINNATGYASRLSVPTFYKSIKDFNETESKAERKTLLYETEKGFMRIVINYTFQ